MGKRTIIFLVIAFLAVVLLTGVTVRQEKNKSTKLPVTASFYPLYFFAREIGGEMADVSPITPSGSEPHDYELTAQDMARIEDSTLLIINGDGLEPWAENITQTVDQARTRIVTASKGITPLTMTEGRDKVIDPHVWLSPKLAVQMVDTIVAGFVAADPTNTSYYEENAVVLKEKLQALDQDYQRALAHCAGNTIVTSHAAFGYLADTYHFNQVPIAGLSPDAEPSPQDLGGVVQLARTYHVKVIFFERLVSPKLAQAVASEVGARVLALNPLEGLTREDIAAGKDYFTEMRTNLTNLITALQCTT